MPQIRPDEVEPWQLTNVTVATRRCRKYALFLFQNRGQNAISRFLASWRHPHCYTERLGQQMTFEEAHIAIKKGDVISLRHALDAGLTPDLSNQFSWTLLMLAAIEGNTAVAKLLISRGADVNRDNNFGDTALSLAANGSHSRFVKLLLVRGASQNRGQPR